VRITGGSPVDLQIKKKKHTLPANSFILLNHTALSTLPEYWGADSLVWRPDRWIVKEEESTSLADEQFLQPRFGAFIPFSFGPRVCPGKKFAQVEFVAVIARLLRRHQVSPVLLEGETIVDAQKRIFEIVEDSDLIITLKMNHPERVKLIWEEVV